MPRLLVTRSDEVMSGAVVFTGTPGFRCKLSSTTSKKGILDHFLEGSPTVSREMPRAQGVAIPIPNDFA